MQKKPGFVTSPEKKYLFISDEYSYIRILSDLGRSGMSGGVSALVCLCRASGCVLGGVFLGGVFIWGGAFIQFFGLLVHKKGRPGFFRGGWSWALSGAAGFVHLGKVSVPPCRPVTLGGGFDGVGDDNRGCLVGVAFGGGSGSLGQLAASGTLSGGGECKRGGGAGGLGPAVNCSGCPLCIPIRRECGAVNLCGFGSQRLGLAGGQPLNHGHGLGALAGGSGYGLGLAGSALVLGALGALGLGFQRLGGSGQRLGAVNPSEKHGHGLGGVVASAAVLLHLLPAFRLGGFGLFGGDRALLNAGGLGGSASEAFHKFAGGGVGQYADMLGGGFNHCPVAD